MNNSLRKIYARLVTHKVKNNLLKDRKVNTNYHFQYEYAAVYFELFARQFLKQTENLVTDIQNCHLCL